MSNKSPMPIPVPGKLMAITRPPVLKLAGPDYLGEHFFLITLVVALLLHAAAIFVWQLVPATRVVDIPVRVLNIKLGGDDASEEAAAAVQPDGGNTREVETSISHLVRDEAAKAPPVKPTVSKDKPVLKKDAAKALDKAISNPGKEAVDAAQAQARKLTSMAKQFVRSNGNQAKIVPVGNTAEARQQEMVSRYEQLISLWIQKFKVYPEEARAKSIEGEALVRIRIDRKGNIRYYILEQSTGSQILDRAAIEMVRKANPVPSVPNDYPTGDLIEFLIPVSYHLQ